MAGDLEPLPAPASAAAPGAGPAAVAAELLGRVRAELPVIGGLGERDQVLVAVWLTGLRSARTRRAYAGDVAAWLGRLSGREHRLWVIRASGAALGSCIVTQRFPTRSATRLLPWLSGI